MNKNERGFTLIEMIVSVGLFAVVMIVCVAALLALANANRKAQALQSVMNNLNIALDGMVREIREGSQYHCGSGTYTTPQDCASSSDDPSNHYLFAFEPFGNQDTDPPWVYVFDTNNSYCGVNTICRSEDGGKTFVALTASEVSINQLQFFVVGTARGGGDSVQPKVVIIIKGTAGTAGAGLSTQTTFHIQATAVQRLLDL